MPLRQDAGMTKYRRDFHRVLIHVHGKRAVPLVPKTVMAAGIAVVAGEDDQRVLAEAQAIQPLENPPNPQVHGSHRGEVAFERFAIPQVHSAARASPGMSRLLRDNS